MDALHFYGKKGVDYHFSPKITAHGDCMDIAGGYIFLTWYKGGMDKRYLMLSRRNMNKPNAPWKTIQFPYQHIGYNGNPKKGDSHNIAAIGICTQDNTIHILFDMHSYEKARFPNNYFNYLVSKKNAAFVPDSEFKASLFYSKKNALRSDVNYENVTYPAFERLTDGSLMARWRYGGNKNGNIVTTKYNGKSWSRNTMLSKGDVPLPNRRGHYGSEKFMHNKFFIAFSVRWAQNSKYEYNSGLYFAYATPPYGKNNWHKVCGKETKLPITNPAAYKVGSPADDYGRFNPININTGPQWTVTKNYAIHMVSRVDGQNVHYYKPSNSTKFKKAKGGLIPHPNGSMFNFGNKVLMIELNNSGNILFKKCPEGTNSWKTIHEETSTPAYRHFKALSWGNKIIVYAMRKNTGKAQPIDLVTFDIGDEFGGIEFPKVNITAPHNNSVFNLGQTIALKAKASDGNGKIIKVNFRINGIYHAQDKTFPYTVNWEPKTSGTYRVDAAAYDNDGNKTISYDAVVHIDKKLVPVVHISKRNTINYSLDGGHGSTNSQNVKLRPDNPQNQDQQWKILVADYKSVKNQDLYHTSNRKNDEISAYPNPGNGFFNLNLDVEWEIYSIAGLKLLNGNGKYVDLSAFSSGIYILKSGNQSQQLIID